MSADSAPDAATPPMRHALIANVDVVVETFVGKTSITVGELNAMGPGRVLVLDAPLNDLVELRVNGLAVAQGELVSVGDCFAVRITSVAP